MTDTQVFNLLTFNTIMLNERIIMPSYIVEKFNSIIGNPNELVVRELLDEEYLNKFLLSIDFHNQYEKTNQYFHNQYEKTNQYFHIDYESSKLLNIKEKMIIFYLRSFSSFKDVFINYDKYIGDLESISLKEAIHIHPLLKKNVENEMNVNSKIINIYKRIGKLNTLLND